MFKDFSKAGIGMVSVAVYLIIWVAQYFNISLAEAQVTTVIQNIVGVYGFVMMVVGQISRKDLIGGVVRK